MMKKENIAAIGGRTRAKARKARSPPAATRPQTEARFDDQALIASAGAGKTTTQYPKNAIVFAQGSAADAIYFIESGNIQLSVVSKQGKTAIIAQLGESDFFGEASLAGQPQHMVSAMAQSEATIVQIKKSTMSRLLRDQPRISTMYTGFLLSRNIQFEADLVDQLFNSSERRLARLLLLLAKFGKGGKMETVIPKVSQEVLAAKVGTTRSRINFFMNKFRKLGLIEYDGGAKKAGGLKVHSSLINIIVHD